MYNSEFKKVPRSTCNDIYKVYAEFKANLDCYTFLFLYKIIVTSNYLECLNNNHYLCVTAYYVDNEWNLQKELLVLENLIFFVLLQILANHMAIFTIIGIENFFSISSNNAIVNTAKIKYLKNYRRPVLDGSLFHICCVCHIINSYVQDILRVINDSV